MAQGNASLLLLLLALSCAAALPRMAAASRALWGRPEFVVQGRVFCDTCLAGFETPATTYISGAKVMVECRDRSTGKVTRSIEGMTDITGTYNILVTGDHESEICESVLLSSPDQTCNAKLAGRDRSLVALTYNNGIPATLRFANALGFTKDNAINGCDLVMQLYQRYEDDV